MSKAFDTLNHEILISKLKYYGLSDSATNLLESYLCNRKQFVDFNGTHSSVCNITTGVPQGSILGPLLFIIYINDITYANELLHLIIYADDTTIYSTLNTLQTNNININDELQKISEWLKANKLSLNVS